MDTSDTLDDVQRARLIESLPSARDARFVMDELQRCHTLAEAEAIIAPYIPAFPMPQGIPLPTWATESGAWEWDDEDQDWSRFVARVGEIGGERIVIDAFQTVAEDGGPVGVRGIGPLFPDFDRRDSTPEELAAVGQWLIDAADAMRRDM
jgi:hypothetical protein